MSILTIHTPFLHKKLCKTAKHIKLKMQFHAKSANVNLSSFPTFNEANSSLFHRRYSIVTPYQLHSKSIVSMEYRWSIDGVSMEKPKSFIERHSGNIRRQYLSFIFTHKYHIHSFIHHRNMTSIDIYTNITISIQTEQISLSPNSPA